MFALVSSLLLSTAATTLSAHELWLEPLAYQVEPSGQLQVQIKNGQDFEGTTLPYLERRFRHFIVFQNGNGIKVAGRDGDIPAMDMTASREGLNIVAYQSTPATINYANWEKFQVFVDHKDFGDVRTEHDARGLPDADFNETYVRYSKALIGVGDGAGADLRVGLETEMVALTNPYTDDLSEGFQVQVFYGDDVRANAQVEVFAKAPDDTVEVTYLHTNAQGIATIPVQSGTAYQLDSVVLRPAGDAVASQGSVYETLWANMTFMAP